MNGAVTIMLVTQCRPLRKVWEPKTKGECWEIHVVKGFGYAAGGMFTPIHQFTVAYSHLNIVFAVVTDFICSILPTAFLWNVQISRRTKVTICLLMSMGLLYVIRIFSTGSTNLHRETNAL